MGHVLGTNSVALRCHPQVCCRGRANARGTGASRTCRGVVRVPWHRGDGRSGDEREKVGKRFGKSSQGLVVYTILYIEIA